MTFNTGNNVPSTDPRDLYDNAENLDKLVNGVDPFYADRKGILRESWAGMENTFDTAQTGRENAFTLSQADKESRFQAFLVSSGYVSKGDYAANVVLAERNEYVAVSATTTGATAGFYRPGPNATLPMTLTGTWATDKASLVLLGDDVLRQELAGSGGAALVGYKSRTVDAVLSERINVKDYGAIGDGVADDTAAIQAAFDAAASAPSVSVWPYQTPPVWFPKGVYKTSSPLHATQALQLDGDNAIIRGMGEGFAAKTVPLAAGGTEQSKALLIFLNGNKGDLSGTVRWSAKVGSGLVLNCNEYAFPAIYIERMCYSHINCEIQGSSQNGLEVGPQMWGLNLDDIIVENVTGSSIALLPGAAANGMSIKNPRLWGEFKEGYCGINFMDGSECNGVSISGGMIEKFSYGVLVGNTNGPIHIDGIYFEYCVLGVVRAVGAESDGRRTGPVKVSNCFLHSVEGPKIYADRALVTVEGCRMFPGSVDFQTDANYQGAIHAGNNEYPGGLDIATGSNIVFESQVGSTRLAANYLPHKIASVITTYDLRNYQYLDSPYLQSSGLNFDSFYSGGASGQYLGRSEWFVSEYQHVTTPGAITNRVGVVLDNFGGANTFRPSADGATSCGSAEARWTQVYAFTGTINTSDAREKQQVRELSDAERAVALRLKSLLRAFKFNDSVAAKGDDARIHFGVIAQDVKAAFEGEGLRAEDYGLLCYDEWPELQEQAAEDGSITQPYRAAGNRYGVRYEELLAFIISAM